VLKKAGIIVTASVAGLLAVSPLAFAAEGNDGDKGGRDANIEYTQVAVDDSETCTIDQEQNNDGFLPILGNVALIPVNVNCVNILGVQDVEG
jgi:hypothetical protein